MKKIYIAGAGGFGQELASWLCSPGGLPIDWQLVGFLDDIASGEPLPGVPVMSTIKNFKAGENEWVVMGVGTPTSKMAVHEMLCALGAKFITYLHPSAIISASASLGDGCVLCPGALVSHRALLGACVTLNAYATVGHNAVVGACSTVSSHVDITGGVVIGQAVLLGSHASVLPGVQVGDRATIGAGSVAVRNVGAGAVVFGVPAKKIFQQ